MKLLNRLTFLAEGDLESCFILVRSSLPIASFFFSFIFERTIYPLLVSSALYTFSEIPRKSERLFLRLITLDFSGEMSSFRLSLR